MNRLNRALVRAGIIERVVQGRGYVYFVDGEAHTWPSSSIAVCWMRDLTPESVVSEWKSLSGQTRTPKEASNV